MVNRNVSVKPGMAVLIFATFFCALLAAQSQVTSDPYARIVAAGLGGIVAVMIGPYWALYRGKAPGWLVAALIVAVDAGVLQINALANQKAFIHVRWYDFWYMLLFAVPGCAKLLLSRGNAGSAGPNATPAGGKE